MAFASPAAEEFDRGAELTLVVGSTGKLTSQIENGAPYDLFFSADKVEGGSPYAIGRIAVWSTDPKLVGPEFQPENAAVFAIANPEVAPYGRAADDWLNGRAPAEKLVTGQNIMQTYQFIESGNADAGVVAWSTLIAQDPIPGSCYLVPTEEHAQILQEVLLLSDSPLAADFLEFVQTDPKARQIIRDFGYLLPEE